MDNVELPTNPETTIAYDATRALVIGAAQVAGSMIGVAVVIGAVYGADAVRTKIANRKNKPKKIKSND